jgi:hypothetical protein
VTILLTEEESFQSPVLRTSVASLVGQVESNSSWEQKKSIRNTNKVLIQQENFEEKRKTRIMVGAKAPRKNEFWLRFTIVNM